MSGVLEIRPTQIREHDAPPEDLAAALLDHFASSNNDITIRSVGQHLVLTHTAHLRHLWSPWLHVEVEAIGSGSRVIAKFSAHPNLWTSFAFGYFTLGTTALFAACFALAQTMLSQSPWAWWVAGVAAALMLAMFLIAKLGQRLAEDQMRDLSERLGAVLAGVESQTNAGEIRATDRV